MPDLGRVLYAEADGNWVFRFEGAIRYTMAHPLDAFLEQVFARGALNSAVADLRDASAIDSTGIGLLAKIARIARDRQAPRPLLFCGNEEVEEMLTSVCMDRVFTMVSGELHPSALSPLAATYPTETQLAGTIEQAHRLLCELSEDNRARFEGVVEAFARLGAER